MEAAFGFCQRRHKLVFSAQPLKFLALMTPSACARYAAVLWALALPQSLAQASTDTHTESVRAALVWNSPRGENDCIKAAELQESVEQRLGRSVFAAPASAEVVLEAALAPIQSQSQSGSQQGWQATLRVSDKAGQLVGTRTITTDDLRCSALTESLVLVASLLVDLPRAQLPVPPEPPSSPSLLTVGLSGEAALGLFALVSPAAKLRVGFKALLPMEIWGQFWFPTETRAGPGGASFLAWQAGFSVCPSFIDGRVAVCAGAGAGLVYAAGVGFDRNQEAHRALVDLRASVRLALPLGRHMRLRLEPGAIVPLVRDTFYFQSAEAEQVVIQRAWAVVPNLGVGLDFGLL